MIQILTNLLINAAKYTRPGGNILLGAELIQGMLLVRVRDDGIGISPEMLDQVFETYWQVPSLNEGPSKGLGIGLSLVKSLVELHGGTIRAYSQGLGAGAEFVVQVPSGCDVDQPAQAGVAKACGSGSSISNHI
jgi:signal transduction histidine kinase